MVRMVLALCIGLISTIGILWLTRTPALGVSRAWQRWRDGRPAGAWPRRQVRRLSTDSTLREAIFRWLDLLYLAASSGMNFHQALGHTAPLTEPVLAERLRRVEEWSATGGSQLDVLAEELGDSSEGTALVRLLADSQRHGLPLAGALAELRGQWAMERRQRIRTHLKTLGIRVTLGTVFLLFPPAFVVILLPNVLAFLGS